MSDEQVGELRYIEELEAEVEKLQRSTVHALYQGQMKRAEAAEAKLAEVETEIFNEPLRAALDDYHGGPDWDEQDADRMGEAFITAFAVLRGEG